MAENTDEILNDLIKYYDGETISVDITEGRATAEKNTAAGETVRINSDELKKIRKDSVVPEETVRIDTKAVRTEEQPVAADMPVQDEVFGFMDIQGNPIEPPSEALSSPEIIEAEPEEDNKADEEPQTPHKRIRQEYDYDEDISDDDDYINESHGIWFRLKPLWITLIVCAIIAGGFKFYITDTGIIGTYKRNFEYNLTFILDTLGISFDFDTPGEETVGEQNSRFVTLADDTQPLESSGEDMSTDTGTDNEHSESTSAYTQHQGDTVSLPFDGAGSSAFVLSDYGIVCAKSNYVCCINENGAIVWEAQTPVTDPAVSTAGKYTAVAAKGGTRICVFRKGEQIYSIDTHDSIVSCSISERGDLALITEKSGYKGSVLVYNKNGEEIFSWSSGVNYIAAVSMLRTRLVAVSLVSTTEKVSSYVMLFDVKQPQPISGIEMAGTLVFDLQNTGNNVVVTGDSSIASFGKFSALSYDMRFDDVKLTHTAADRNGNRIVSYTQNNSPVLCIYSRKGDIEYDSIIESEPDCVDIFGTTMLYNNERQIICGRYTNNKLTEYTASAAPKKLMLMSSRAYMIVYSNSLEIVRI